MLKLVSEVCCLVVWGGTSRNPPIKKGKKHEVRTRRKERTRDQWIYVKVENTCSYAQRIEGNRNVARNSGEKCHARRKDARRAFSPSKKKGSRGRSRRRVTTGRCKRAAGRLTRQGGESNVG